MTKPAFYSMSLSQISAWVIQNNDHSDCQFDEFPATDDLSDEKEIRVRDEYESMAEEIYAGLPDSMK